MQHDGITHFGSGTISINASELLAVCDKLSNFQIKTQLYQILNEYSNELLRQAKINTPVDTGLLKKSWKITEKNKNELRIVIENDAKRPPSPNTPETYYASFVEEGTSLMDGQYFTLSAQKYVDKSVLPNIINKHLEQINNELESKK